jgi:hypothetical protein
MTMLDTALASALLLASVNITLDSIGTEQALPVRLLDSIQQQQVEQPAKQMSSMLIRCTLL